MGGIYLPIGVPYCIHHPPPPIIWGSPPPYPPSTMTGCQAQKGGQSPKSSSIFLF